MIKDTRVVQKVQGAPYKIKLSLHCYEHGIKCFDATLGALKLYHVNFTSLFLCLTRYEGTVVFIIHESCLNLGITAVIEVAVDY